MTNKTAKPRFTAIQAELSDEIDLNAIQLNDALSFIETKRVNAYAKSLSSQLEKYNGLTAKQWQLAYDCWHDFDKAELMHKKAKSSRGYSNGKPMPKQDSDSADNGADQAIQNKQRHLNAKQTRALQDIIKSHPKLDDFKAAFNVQRLRLQGKQLFDACDYMGIDIDAVLKDRADQMQSAFAAPVANGNDSGAIDWERVRAIARDEVERRAKPVTITKLVLDQGKTKKPVDIAGRKHPQFDNLFIALNTTDYSGNYLNVILCGPTGTGKSFAARQIANVLGLTFFLQVQALENYDLIGYEKINGELKETPFLRAFRDGGLILLDELDSYDPKALTALNSALANGELLAPDGTIIPRHSDFRAIGATNTNGLGATHDYTSREALDLATLSRFTVQLDWHTDKSLEAALAAQHGGDVGKAWAAECDKARDAMAQLDLPALVDQRTIEAGIGLLTNGMAIETVRNLTYLARLSADQKTAIKNIVGE